MTNVSATHKVYDYFFQLCPDETPCHQLAALAVFNEYPAGTQILDAGGHTDYIALVLQGMVRGFYIDEEGNDVIEAVDNSEVVDKVYEKYMSLIGDGEDAE